MAQHPRSYEIDMVNGPILPALLRFAVPLMCSSILQLLFNAADIVVVGRFAGDNSLAAVGSNSSLINLLINLFIGLSVGANILAARHRGAGAQEELRQTVHTAMLLSLVSGFALTLVGVSLARTILVWMQAPPEVLDLAALYLRIYFLGMPATMLYNFGAALLRAVGDTRRPFCYLLTAGVINVILNLFFVIVCRLDVAGVGLATVISQCVSAFLVVRCLMREKGPVHLDLQQLRFYSIQLKRILRVGIPAGVQSVLFALSNVVIQSSVNSFGEITMAGNAAAYNIECFVYTAMNAFHQASISFTSQNLGAGKYERLWKILLWAQGCVIVVGASMSTLAYLFGPQLLGIYSQTPEVIAAGMKRLSIICKLYAVCGVMDVMVGSLRGIGYSVLPTIVTLIGACGLRLVWIATVFQIPAYHTIQTVYWSYPISWSITLVAHFICFLWGMGKLRHRLVNHPASNGT